MYDSSDDDIAAAAILIILASNQTRKRRKRRRLQNNFGSCQVKRKTGGSVDKHETRNYEYKKEKNVSTDSCNVFKAKSVKQAKSEELQNGFQFVSCDTSNIREEYGKEDDIKEGFDFSCDYIKNEKEIDNEEDDVSTNNRRIWEEQETSHTNVTIKEEVEFMTEYADENSMRDFS